MRYSSLLLLVGLLTTLSAQAQSQPDDRLAREYNRQRLSLELRGLGIITAHQNLNSATYRELRSWVPYRGFEQISEEEFFRIAGYEYEAGQARAHHQATRGIERIGWILFGAGVMGFALALDDVDNDAAMLIGVVGTSGGLGFLYAGMQRRHTNWAPAEAAAAAMDDYNESLIYHLSR